MRAGRAAMTMVAWALFLALLMAQTALAGPATEQLKTEIDRAVKVLEDPALKAADKAGERRQAIRRVSDGVFDWKEMARRALGQHWQARSEAEREEFVALFTDLLEHSYMTKIEGYSGEKITYAGESVDGDQASVRTRIITKQSQEVPVDYRMIRRGDRWLVYDVVIEGISLVGNYRTQFNKIIQTSSYAELVKKMKVKQDEFIEAATKKS